jgi:hypothetical protein
MNENEIAKQVLGGGFLVYTKVRPKSVCDLRTRCVRNLRK